MVQSHEFGSISTVLAGSCRHNSCCSSRKQYRWAMSQQEDHKLCAYRTPPEIVEPSRLWSHFDRGAVTIVEPIVEPSRSWSHYHDRGAVTIVEPLSRSWSRHDRGAIVIIFYRSTIMLIVPIGFLFHGACWGAIAFPNSGRKSSMFHTGPLAVEIVLDLHGSHENFQSQWTISFVGRE